MTDLHPEALLHRAAAGTLDHDGRARLRAHLEECASCRLEVSIRDAATRDTQADKDDAAMLERLAGAAIVRAATPTMHARRMSSTTGFALGVVAGIVALLLLSAAVRLGRATLIDEDGPRSQAEAIGAQQSAGGVASEQTPPPATAPVRPATRPRQPIEPAVKTEAMTAAPTEEPPTTRRRPVARPPKPEAKVEQPAQTDAAPLEATPTGPDEPASSAAELFSRATAASRRGETDAALAQFVELRERFPVSREARTSWVLGGRMQLEAGKAKAALASFDQYLEGDVRGPLVPEAMAGRAKALGALGRTQPAQAQWQAIVDRFPRSSAAAEAKRRLAGGTTP